MRDDKSYPFLSLTRHQLFPRLSMVRLKKKPSQGHYFGPFPSVAAVRETLKVVQKVFLLRQCSDLELSQRTRPCLQYQIQRCSAPCVGYIGKTEYAQAAEEVALFLSGKAPEILDNMAARMIAASERQAYEDAARLRDQIKQLRMIQEQQGVILGGGDCDVIAIEARLGFACVLCVTYRDGAVLAQESFFPKMPSSDWQESPDILWQAVFLAFIHHHYLAMPTRIPKKILTQSKVTEQEVIEDLLKQASGQPCKIQSQPRGSYARLVDFAENNLARAISAHDRSTHEINKRYAALVQRLDLSQAIVRMECFDVSHTQGSETVASCVVFDAQGPCHRAYRRYLIKDVTPGDDYAAMTQALTRRFKRREVLLPNVLIIDGGKGQVSVAKAVLEALSIVNIKLIGIAKGPARKAGLEHIIIADSDEEVQWPADDPALHLLQHIRDEAHRFAITLHRKRRNKQGLSSTLTAIEGIGPKRRQALLKRFGGLQELTKASVEEIAKVSGMSLALAQKVYAHFR